MVRKLSLTTFAVLIVISGCSKDPRQTGIELLPDMIHAVPYEAYSSNPVLPGGQTNMLPPEGSIARGKMPFRYTKSEDDFERAGRELKNPFPTTEKSLARGKVVFSNFCLPCHGEQGHGDGPLIPKFPNPPSFAASDFANYSEGKIIHVMNVGFGGMPSHGSQIAEDDKWYLAQYVRKLQLDGQKK